MNLLQMSSKNPRGRELQLQHQNSFVPTKIHHLRGATTALQHSAQPQLRGQVGVSRNNKWQEQNHMHRKNPSSAPAPPSMSSLQSCSGPAVDEILDRDEEDEEEDDSLLVEDEFLSSEGGCSPEQGQHDNHLHHDEIMLHDDNAPPGATTHTGEDGGHQQQHQIDEEIGIRTCSSSTTTSYLHTNTSPNLTPANRMKIVNEKLVQKKFRLPKNRRRQFGEQQSSTSPGVSKSTPQRMLIKMKNIKHGVVLTTTSQGVTSTTIANIKANLNNSGSPFTGTTTSPAHHHTKHYAMKKRLIYFLLTLAAIALVLALLIVLAPHTVFVFQYLTTKTTALLNLGGGGSTTLIREQNAGSNGGSGSTLQQGIKGGVAAAGGGGGGSSAAGGAANSGTAAASSSAGSNDSDQVVLVERERMRMTAHDRNSVHQSTTSVHSGTGNGNHGKGIHLSGRSATSTQLGAGSGQIVLLPHAGSSGKNQSQKKIGTTSSNKHGRPPKAVSLSPTSTLTLPIPAIAGSSSSAASKQQQQQQRNLPRNKHHDRKEQRNGVNNHHTPEHGVRADLPGDGASSTGPRNPRVNSLTSLERWLTAPAGNIFPEKAPTAGQLQRTRTAPEASTNSAAPGGRSNRNRREPSGSPVADGRASPGNYLASGNIEGGGRAQPPTSRSISASPSPSPGAAEDVESGTDFLSMTASPDAGDRAETNPLPREEGENDQEHEGHAPLGTNKPGFLTPLGDHSVPFQPRQESASVAGVASPPPPEGGVGAASSRGHVATSDVVPPPRTQENETRSASSTGAATSSMKILHEAAALSSSRDLIEKIRGTSISPSPARDQLQHDDHHVDHYTVSEDTPDDRSPDYTTSASNASRTPGGGILFPETSSNSQQQHLSTARPPTRRAKLINPRPSPSLMPEEQDGTTGTVALDPESGLHEDLPPRASSDGVLLQQFRRPTVSVKTGGAQDDLVDRAGGETSTTDGHREDPPHDSNCYNDDRGQSAPAPAEAGLFRSWSTANTRREIYADRNQNQSKSRQGDRRQTYDNKIKPQPPSRDLTIASPEFLHEVSLRLRRWSSSCAKNASGSSFSFGRNYTMAAGNVSALDALNDITHLENESADRVIGADDDDHIMQLSTSSRPGEQEEYTDNHPPINA
ncbi:unnamed protein product [Amoebophrya sp. A120]|nr:unnamed protein product [Amoebophrya sp. A120]|eukprot:GSA120T00007245001.1